MNRITLIQRIIQEANFKTYLEIGTQSGKSLLPLKCKYKIAVDPDFCIPFEKKLKWLFKNPSNFRNKYFEETSDDFFNKRKSMLQKKYRLDVVLIDGLHTFEASLRDVLNSLEYLNSEGVIIMHDCYPPNIASAKPANSYDDALKLEIDGWTVEWCGDIWKTIVYLRRKFSDFLDVYVINTDYGLGIIRIKSEINRSLNIDKELFDEINKMQFEEIMQDYETMTGLKDIDFTENLINEFAAYNKN